VSLSAKDASARVGRLIELLLFPSFCHLCRAPLERPTERIVCSACLSSLVAYAGPVCPRCGRALQDAGGEHLCARCLTEPPVFSRHRSCGLYGGTLKDVILLFKYRKYAPLSRPLARFAEATLGAVEGLWAGAEALVPVPLHRARRRDRGFNQSRLLARDLGRLRGIEVLDRVLVKVRDAPPQAGLRAADRARNVIRTYAVRRPELVRGRTVVLVDDVTTTGATLSECARVLTEAGTKDVRAITLAQA
jgi:competence protein ComFC